MKCFKQLQRQGRKGRISKSMLAFGNDAEVAKATVVIIKDSRGMKCSNFLTDLQLTWHFRKNYEEEHTVGKWPYIYSKVKILS